MKPLPKKVTKINLCGMHVRGFKEKMYLMCFSFPLHQGIPISFSSRQDTTMIKQTNEPLY